jgi:hypothetical protein
MKERKAINTTQEMSQPLRVNYYNYFTEIEEAFVRRRGRHLLVSDLDWTLMDSWKQMGIPLHVVLRGIERAFDSYESKPRKRSVKTLFYCQEEVEAQYAEWLESQLGAGSEPPDEEKAGGQAKQIDTTLPFPRAVILEHMERARASLSLICSEREKSRKDDFCDALSRAAARLKELEEDFSRAARPNAEKLEESLTGLEKLLDEALLSSLAADELNAASHAAIEQLQPYRNRMERAVFEQTLENLLLKRLRDAHELPRLSLFYL